MGLIIDTGVLIGAERRHGSAKRALQDIYAAYPLEHVAISCITVAELAHGAERADTVQRMQIRRDFLDDVLLIADVHPISVAIARRAGELDGIGRRKGIQIGLADLLIGATALELHCGVLTYNTADFLRIPGVQVLQP